MSGWLWAVAAFALVALALVLGTRRFWRERERASGAPPRVLERGWQFYPHPTTLEPPGTIFRIDREGRRLLVTTLRLESSSGREASGHSEEAIATTFGIVARVLALDIGGRLAGRRVQQLRFELLDPEQEVTDDIAVEAALEALGADLGYRADNRYFVIRAARRAAGMVYRLSDEQVDELGGRATLEQLAEQRAELSLRRRRMFELDQRFPEVMRVMYLAEEIKPVSAALAGEAPELGLVPVREVLEWEPP